MKRKDILTRAMECVCGGREQDYGRPEDNFGLISELWTAYIQAGIKREGHGGFGYRVTPRDVAILMALLKVARISGGGGSGDSYVDLAGYAACAGEMDNMKNPVRDRSLRCKLDRGAIKPVRAHETDAGLDLFSNEKVVVPANGIASLDTGVHVQIPAGYVGLLTSKSGLMAKGITCRGTIDSGYTGSIRAVLYNHTNRDCVIDYGYKVTQLVVLPCCLPELEIVDSLPETERGDSGFGSTGK